MVEIQTNQINSNSNTTIEVCSNLKKGGYVLIKSNPYKIINTYTTQTELVQLTAVHLFTGDKVVEWFHGADPLEVPIVSHKEYQFDSIQGDSFILKDRNGKINSHVLIPEGERGEEIKKTIGSGQGSYSVTVVTALGGEGFDSIHQSN